MDERVAQARAKAQHGARPAAQFTRTRPTPTPSEANRLAATGELPMVKRWDLSPVGAVVVRRS